MFGSNLLTGKEFWTAKDKDYVGGVGASVMDTMWENFPEEFGGVFLRQEQLYSCTGKGLRTMLRKGKVKW